MDAIDVAKQNFPNYKFPKNKFVKGIYFKTKENLKLKILFIEQCCLVMLKKELILLHY